MTERFALEPTTEMIEAWRSSFGKTTKSVACDCPLSQAAVVALLGRGFTFRHISSAVEGGVMYVGGHDGGYRALVPASARERRRAAIFMRRVDVGSSAEWMFAAPTAWRGHGGHRFEYVLEERP
jgi:hypothetical protein